MNIFAKLIGTVVFGIIAIGTISVGLQDLFGIDNSDGCFVGLLIMIAVSIIKSMFIDDDI